MRGPLSAKVLGLGSDKYITDGAALLNTLAEFKPLPENERSGVIFILIIMPSQLVTGRKFVVWQG